MSEVVDWLAQDGLEQLPRLVELHPVVTRPVLVSAVVVQVWAATVIPAWSKRRRSSRLIHPGLSSTTAMAKNVAVIERRRSWGSPSVIWLP